MQVTIGIATWNRSALLRQTLESLAALEIPRGIRATVIVADNNSSDDTKAVVEAIQPRLGPDLSLEYLFESTQGKSHALNALIAAARGEWLLLLDDDVLVEPGWLELYVRAMNRYPKAACLGGGIVYLAAGDDSMGLGRAEEEPGDRTLDDPPWGEGVSSRMDGIRSVIGGSADSARRGSGGTDCDLVSPLATGPLAGKRGDVLMGVARRAGRVHRQLSSADDLAFARAHVQSCRSERGMAKRFPRYLAIAQALAAVYPEVAGAGRFR